jgi:hypothetical protein
MRFALAVAFVNAFLSLYFMLKITRNFTDQTFLRFEGPAYVISLLVPLTFGVIGIVTESFNTSEAYRICVYGDYPPLCSESLDVECQRGSTYKIQDYVFTGVLLIMTISSIACVIRLYVHVRAQLRASRTQAFHSTFDETAKKRSRGTDQLAIFFEYRIVTPLSHTLFSVLFVAVLVQSMLYTFAYLNGLLWSILERIVTDAMGETDTGGKPGIFILQIVSYIMFPLQGFFNFIIFIRPLYLQRRKDCSTESRVQTIILVLHGEKSPPLVASSNHLKRTNTTSNHSNNGNYKCDLSNRCSSGDSNHARSNDRLDSFQHLESIDEASFEMPSESPIQPDDECTSPLSLSD